MIGISRLRVNKNGRTICSVPELEVGRGERLAIVGPNGSGKTTLLRLLSGLLPDYAGTCNVAVAPRDRVYVHQSPYLFRGTVLFNAAYGLTRRGISRGERERAARHWLQRFGLEEMAGDRVEHLSGGERRRVALARALVLRPPLLLLDEPFADMDEEGVSAVGTAIDELVASTILIASPTSLPQDMAARAYRLESPAGELD